MADKLSRRTVVSGAAAATGLAAAAGVLGASTSKRSTMTQPAIYLPHGGGPWPWMEGFGGPGALDPLRSYLEGLPGMLPEPPKAILCITAHWEAPVPTVSTSERPPMLYDYSGFPQHTYQIQWPAPGSPTVASRVRELLGEAGIETAEDHRRGFDHGTFVPLAVAWPDAQVPTVQLSLVRGLDPETHVAIGRALRPLRDEGVLIVGSGMSYHNMRGFMSGGGTRDSQVFDDWLGRAVSAAEGREQALCDWSSAPSARACHPREEHLLPLMVVSGAAEGDEATRPFQGDVLGVRVSAVHYG